MGRGFGRGEPGTGWKLSSSPGIFLGLIRGGKNLSSIRFVASWESCRAKALCQAVPVPLVAALLGAGCAGCRSAGDSGGAEGRARSGAGLLILQPLPEAFVKAH